MLDINHSRRVVKDDEFDIPMSISDIIEVCQEYSKLENLQDCIEDVIDDNVDALIKSGKLNIKSIPKLLVFLDKISNNPYFGDASYQAEQLIITLKKCMRNHNNLLN